MDPQVPLKTLTQGLIPNVSLKFIEELRNVYTQVVDVRGKIPHSPTETVKFR